MFNFVIYTDKNGKMPVLKPLGVPLGGPVCKSHRYWVEYRNNTPVKCKPYPGQEQMWDYKQNKHVPITSLSREG